MGSLSVADCVALSAQISDDLALVVEAWADLPEAIQQAIVAMVDAVRLAEPASAGSRQGQTLDRQGGSKPR